MIPNRLTARDLRLQLQWLNDEWTHGEVWANEKKIARFRRYIAGMSEPHHTQALELLDELGKSQLVTGDRHHVLIRQLNNVVTGWHQSRPDAIKCGHDYGNGVKCDVEFASELSRAAHQELVHDLKGVA